MAATIVGDGSNSKQRLFRALLGESSEGVPAVPAYLSLFLADFERAYYIEQYRRRMRGIDRYPVDHGEDTRFRAEALYQAYGIFKARPDWIEVSRGASRAWAERTEIVVHQGVLYYTDKVSGQQVPMHQAPLPGGEASLTEMDLAEGDLWDISAQFQSLADVDARLPLLTPVELLARGDFELARKVVADYGDRFFISTILDTPFSDAYDLLGFQGLMLAQHDKPELLHYLLQRKLAQTQAVMGAWATTGIHGVYVQEAFSGADMISARSYDEFVFTYNQPYFRHMTGLGLRPIHYVCGNVVPRLERLAQLDIAAVAVEESKKNFRIELEEVVERVAGRVAVFGNIDAVRFGGQASLASMAAEVRRQAAIGSRARGFIASTGSPFPLDTNPRLVDVLVETAHQVILER